METFKTRIGTDLEEAEYWLKKDKCVAIPTETVYGLAANALHEASVLSIFETKNRPQFDPLIVHVASKEDLEPFTRSVPPRGLDLIEAYWPGPLTILLERTTRIPDLVCSGLPRAAFRAPAHPVSHALLERLPFPLAAPSANPFGYISPTTAEHVRDQLGGKIPYILDGGPSEIGLESTIVGFEKGDLCVYRLGGLSLEALESTAGSAVQKIAKSSNPAAPGMLTTHYAPRKPLLLRDFAVIPVSARVGVLQFQKSSAFFAEDPRVVKRLILSEKGDLEQAAQRLFALLRELDQSEAEYIVAEKCPESFLGRAINDRLSRASVE